MMERGKWSEGREIPGGVVCERERESGERVGGRKEGLSSSFGAEVHHCWKAAACKKEVNNGGSTSVWMSCVVFLHLSLFCITRAEATHSAAISQFMHVGWPQTAPTGRQMQQSAPDTAAMAHGNCNSKGAWGRWGSGQRARLTHKWRWTCGTWHRAAGRANACCLQVEKVKINGWRVRGCSEQ